MPKEPTKQRRRWLWIGALVLILGWSIMPVAFPYDRDLNLPTDVARLFVEAVRRDDYALAASYWTPGDISHVERNFGLSFQEFCRQRFHAQAYTVKLIETGKEGSYVVAFRGEVDGKPSTFGLYLARHAGRWRLIEDLIYPSGKRP